MKKNSIKKVTAAAAAAVMMIAGLPALSASAASSSVYSSAYPYYSAVTGLYYNDYNQALNASAGNAQHVYNGYYVYNGSTVYPYYSTYTNTYYATYSAALAASGGVESRVISNASYKGTATGYSANYPYYSSYTGLYYPTFDDAVIASLGRSGYVTKVEASTGADVNYSSAYPYYSKITGRYYASYTDALKASASDSSNIVYVGSSSNVYPAYYTAYSPYYYYPYYYTPVVTATSSSGTEAADGVPFLYGYNRVWGWTTLAKRISNLKSGSVFTVDMNGSTLVPSEILRAAKQRNVNLRLLLDNGALWDISGGNVYDTAEADFSVVYGTKNVPSSLVKSAAKGAVSSAEISIGNAKSPFDISGVLTVRFSPTRADCFVKVYLYDEESGSLKLVDKSQVDASGYVKFSVKSCGSYVFVLS